MWQRKTLPFSSLKGLNPWSEKYLPDSGCYEDCSSLLKYHSPANLEIKNKNEHAGHYNAFQLKLSNDGMLR